MKTKRQRIFEVIQIGNRGDAISRAGDYFIVVVIFVNIAVLFMETFAIFQPYMNVLKIIEAITIGIFIVEYILRLWTADYLYPQYHSRLKAAGRFLISFDGIVDLLTILPFFFLSGFVGFRIRRVVRIFRLFRVNATYDSFNVIAHVFQKKKNQIFSSVFIILMLMLVSSLCMYSAEHEAQPELFKNAFSGIWWSLSTIFTVGYGDIYAVTPLGQIMTVVITFLGVGAVAIPTGIISAGFVEEYAEIAKANQIDPGARHTLIEYISEKSAFIGVSVREIEEKGNCNIMAIQREGEILVPSDDTIIRSGDTLISERFM